MMKPFLQAHATHPDWRLALALMQPQLEAQQRERGSGWAPTLGWIYLTDHHAAQAEALLAELQQRWPGVAWVGSVGIGVAAGGVEYIDEPALTLMLSDLPATSWRVFSGARPLADFMAHTALVHADPATPELPELIVDMSEKTASGYLFGGLASSRRRTLTIADAVLEGGLSGVAFGPEVALVSRVTQGCQPVGPRRSVTAVQHNVVTQLDGEPALDCLLADLGLTGRDPREALTQIRQTLVGLSDPADGDASGPGGMTRPGAFGSDTRVRHLIGLDPVQRGIAIAEQPEVGQQLAFCQRHTEAARRDLVRICTEIREELAPEHEPALARGAAPEPAGASMLGAVYVSCSGRGGPHFGAPSAELAIVRRALGEVPLVGFFAAGEIARHHLYGYTGVLTVFTTPR